MTATSQGWGIATMETRKDLPQISTGRKATNGMLKILNSFWPFLLMSLQSSIPLKFTKIQVNHTKEPAKQCGDIQPEGNPIDEKPKRPWQTSQKLHSRQQTPSSLSLLCPTYHKLLPAILGLKITSKTLQCKKKQESVEKKWTPKGWNKC